MGIGEELRAGGELDGLREQAVMIIQTMAQNYEEHGEAALEKLEWLRDDLDEAMEELRQAIAAQQSPREPDPEMRKIADCIKAWNPKPAGYVGGRMLPDSAEGVTTWEVAASGE